MVPIDHCRRCNTLRFVNRDILCTACLVAIWDEYREDLRDPDFTDRFTIMSLPNDVEQKEAPPHADNCDVHHYVIHGE